jgi:hypothetical protein
VNVQSSQTVALGGLIQDSETRGRDRIPILGEIPVVGSLFGTTNVDDQRTELIVFITPRVIRNPEDARDVSEELRARLRSLRPFSSEAALPPVPQPNRTLPPPPPLPPTPVPAGSPQPLVPRGTLGQAAPPAAPAVVPAGYATAARAREGVPEEWLPELVGLRQAAAAEAASPAPAPVPPAPAARPEPGATPVGFAAVTADADPAAGGVTRVAFDLARAPVPRVRPVSHVPDPPPPRPAGVAAAGG